MYYRAVLLSLVVDIDGQFIALSDEWQVNVSSLLDSLGIFDATLDAAQKLARVQGPDVHSPNSWATGAALLQCLGVLNCCKV